MSKKLICFAEGPSDEIFLESLVENIKKKHHKRTEVECLSFSGYPGLKNNCAKFLQGYDTNNVFLILVDKDDADCRTRKKKIFQKVEAANNKRPIKIRVACRQLESFYFGDLDAVKKGLNIPSKKLLQRQTKKLFNNPDNITNPVEELKKLTGSINKRKLAEVVTPHLRIDGTNKSHSFNVLVTAIKHLL